MKRRFVGSLVRSQLGATLLEFFAFLALAMLLLSGALILYRAGASGSQSTELAAGINTFALGAKQAAAGGDGRHVSVASIQPPASWQPAVTGWTYSDTTVTFINHRDGFFTLQVSGLPSADVARQLAGMRIFQVSGLPNGDTAVVWKRISFQ